MLVSWSRCDCCSNGRLQRPEQGPRAYVDEVSHYQDNRPTRLVIKGSQVDFPGKGRRLLYVHQPELTQIAVFF